jgi:NAD(P)-dependent dehydrogenase (short-subunit alcohol dehydrogenase family)
MKLANKVAIITGAGAGMGKAAAILFAREGAKIAAVDVDEKSVLAVVQQITAAGGKAIAIAADITRTADVLRIVDRTVAELGLPTVLYNNAGTQTEKKMPILKVTEEQWDRVIEVNLKGVWLMIKHVAPKMIEAGGGSIVNTGSIGAFVTAGSAGYCASKAGVVALTRAAAVELGRYNIRVNALNPGATGGTAMSQKSGADMAGRGLVGGEAFAKTVSVLGRMAKPEEMANMALFLASDDSSYATGTSFNNDGGWLAMGGIDVGA